jgi:hypothetical protein
MSAVAERFVIGMFAGAPSHGLGLGQIHFDRRKIRAFMGTVAERLGRRFTACAPPICAGLNFLHNGTFLENNWIAHALLLAKKWNRCKQKGDFSAHFAAPATKLRRD